MPYILRTEDRIIHVYWYGVISREDVQAIGAELPRAAQALGHPSDVLHTFDGVLSYSFQPLVVYMVSLLRKRVTIPQPVRSASVAITAEAQAIAKLFKTLNRTRNLEMEVFASEAAARRWLSEARAGSADGAPRNANAQGSP